MTFSVTPVLPEHIEEVVMPLEKLVSSSMCSTAANSKRDLSSALTCPWFIQKWGITQERKPFRKTGSLPGQLLTELLLPLNSLSSWFETFDSLWILLDIRVSSEPSCLPAKPTISHWTWTLYHLLQLCCQVLLMAAKSEGHAPWRKAREPELAVQSSHCGLTLYWFQVCTHRILQKHRFAC